MYLSTHTIILCFTILIIVLLFFKSIFMKNKNIHINKRIEQSIPTQNIIDHFYSQKEPKSCKLCSKIPKTSRKCLYNLRIHIKNAHKLDYIGFIEGYIEKLQSNLILHNHGIINVYSDNIRFFANAFSMSMMPINAIEDSGIKYIIHMLDPKVIIPCRRSITNYLKSYCVDLKHKIKKELKTCDNYSFSIDLWSFNTLVYASLLVKYKIKSNIIVKTVSINQLSNQKAVTITDFIEQTFKFYDIEASKIVSFTSDNCNSMIRSIKNLSNARNLEEELDLSSDIVSSKINTEEYNHSGFNLGSYCASEYSKSFIGIGCQIHTLQLCIKDNIKNNDFFINLFEKVRKILIKLRTSKFNKNFPGVPNENPTRWDYYYEILNYFNSNYENIYSTIIENNDIIKVELDGNNEVLASREFSVILKAFKILTKCIENSEFFCGDYFYQLNLLNKKLESIINGKISKNKHVQKFTMDLHSSIENRIYNKEKSTLYLKELSLFFVPQYFFKCSSEDKSKMTSYLLEYGKEHLKVVSPISSQINNPLSVEQIMDGVGASKPHENSNEGIEKEIARYNCSDSFLRETTMFWEMNKHKYINLYSIYSRIQTVFVGNGEVERLFSRMKLLSHWHRGRIKSDTIEARILSNEEYNFSK